MTTEKDLDAFYLEINEIQKHKGIDKLIYFFKKSPADFGIDLSLALLISTKNQKGVQEERLDFLNRFEEFLKQEGYGETKEILFGLISK